MRIGLLGCGTVGGALVELLGAEATAIEARTGLRLEVGPVAVRDVGRVRPGVAPEQLVDDPRAVVADSTVELVVELMGGVDPARALVLAALEAGKPVVTANKALLAAHGDELATAADRAGVDLLFEAAVGGGIPVIRPLRESLLAEPIQRVLGIVNGTTNFILTRMSTDGVSYADALAEAQRLGYAEADPSADVDGHDAAAKLAILASIAFGVRVVAGDVHTEGIASLSPDDVAYAARNGLVVKLLAIGERVGTQIAVRVHPALVPAAHPLASVRGAFNAVFVEGAAVGELMFYGRGAGGAPTASAVLGDVVDAAVNRRRGTHAPLGALPRASVAAIDALVSEYSISLEVVDRHGVLAAVASAFAQHEVSIRSVVQEGAGHEASLVFVTHAAREADVRATLDDLRGLDSVRRVGSVLRLVGTGA